MESDITWRTASDMLLEVNRQVVYVGVFDTDTFEPVSISGSNCIRRQHVSPESAPTEQWMVEVSPRQARGLYSHIKYGRSPMVQINIAKLHFVCLRHGTLNCLTGMSNFNMDDTTIEEVGGLLFTITNVKYTRQESIEGIHALNIAAMVIDDLLLVAISKSKSDVSLLEKLKQLVLIKDGKLSINDMQAIEDKKERDKIKKENERKNEKVYAKDETNKRENVKSILFDEGFPSNGTNDQAPDPEIELTDISRVKMRASTKSDSEKKHEQLKRQTSFCEDWRTATIRSIEALQSIGPFGLNQNDNDKQPLMEDSGVFVANTDRRECKLEMKANWDSVSSEGDGDAGQTNNEDMTDIADATFARKNSRVTLV